MLFVALERFSSTRARCPTIELDAAIRTLDCRRQRTKVAGRRRGSRVGQRRRLLLLLVLVVQLMLMLGFRWRPSVQQLLLERVQLLHKMEVWIDVGLALHHHGVRIVQRQLLVGHQVRQHHGHRTRYACQTVYQNAFLLFPTFICKR